MSDTSSQADEVESGYQPEPEDPIARREHIRIPALEPARALARETLEARAADVGGVPGPEPEKSPARPEREPFPRGPEHRSKFRGILAQVTAPSRRALAFCLVCGEGADEPVCRACERKGWNEKALLRWILERLA